MPTFSSVQIPPPKNWQDFEDLCCDLWKEIWEYPETQKNGRTGQAQHGVDVYGRPDSGELWAGIQCKGKTNYFDISLTEKEIDAEIEKAKNFKPKLKQFIIASTGKKDVKLEEYARELTDKHFAIGLFSVTVFAWEDIQERLSDYPDLIKKHYPQFFISEESKKVADGVDQLYLSYLEQWEEKAGLDDWEAWTSHLLGSGHPSIWAEWLVKLEELRTWLFSREWPGHYKRIEYAFENFRRILVDLYNLLIPYLPEPTSKDDILWMEKFYQIDEWDEKKYDRLHRKFEFIVYLIHDLVAELTRAGNYICETVRESIEPLYRIEQGALLIQVGPYMDFSWRKFRLKYKDEEKTQTPYKDLESFLEERKSRDICFGGNLKCEDIDEILGKNNPF